MYHRSNSQSSSCGNQDYIISFVKLCRPMAMLLLTLLVLLAISLASAWENCSLKDGGGMCPNGSVCCPSSKARRGISSACVPTAHSSLPNAAQTGKCCGDFATGCPFGYQCGEAVKESATNSSNDAWIKDLCIPTSSETVQVDDDQQPWATHAVPRYQLCQVPSKMRQLHGFPISSRLLDSQQQASPPCPSHRKENGTSKSLSFCRDDTTLDGHDGDDGDNDDSVFHLGYYSSQGSITSSSSSSAGVVHANVETVVIILHGSLRDADDYFCTGLSLLEKNESSSSSSPLMYDESVLILAPWFASVSDDMDGTGGGETLQRLLVWDDAVNAYDSFFWHLWRYGADAKNAPISSYTALDRTIEHLVLETDQFPRLQQITVVGHSAGGQMAHRWALLSSSPAWDVSNIRVVAANPRSYAYLDERRWYSSDPSTSTKDFRKPVQGELDACPEYNHWLWGLQDGGDLPCPYRDDAMAETRSKAVLAQRYAARDVHYLSGQFDIIPQDHDHCAALLQGRNRNERARNYFSGLQEYFGFPAHKLHFVPFSGHDHALMFQSPIGRLLIMGKGTNNDAAHLEEVEDARSFSQTSRFIVPRSENP